MPNGAILQPVEVYRSEIAEILRRLGAGEISHADCIKALDAAVVGLVPQLSLGQIQDLRELLIANNDSVYEEMKRRGKAKAASGLN